MSDDTDDPGRPVGIVHDYADIARRAAKIRRDHEAAIAGRPEPPDTSDLISLHLTPGGWREVERRRLVIPGTYTPPQQTAIDDHRAMKHHHSCARPHHM